MFKATPLQLNHFNNILNIIIPKRRLEDILPLTITIFNGNKDNLIVGESNEVLVIKLPYILPTKLIKVVDVTNPANPKPIKFGFLNPITGELREIGNVLVIKPPTTYPSQKRIIQIQKANINLTSLDVDDSLWTPFNESEWSNYIKIIKKPHQPMTDQIPTNPSKKFLNFYKDNDSESIHFIMDLISPAYGYNLDTNTNTNYLSDIGKFLNYSYVVNIIYFSYKNFVFKNDSLGINRRDSFEYSRGTLGNLFIRTKYVWNNAIFNYTYFEPQIIHFGQLIFNLYTRPNKNNYWSQFWGNEAFYNFEFVISNLFEI